MREDARGTYWRHGSVIHETDRLSRPILAIGGWADRYCNSVMALSEARPDLVKGIVGPWGHHYPDHGKPGPALGFQRVALDWWNRWLCGEDKAQDWPHLQVWMRDYQSPEDRINVRKGHWVETGPAAGCTSKRIYNLTSKGLRQDNSVAGDWPVPGDLDIGCAAGDTGYFGRVGGLPLDQAGDDEKALSFETPTFENECFLYGTSRLKLSTKDRAGQIIARLCDLAPDGTSVLICRTVRNLALNDDLDAVSNGRGEAAGRDVTVPFPAAAYRLRKGHKLRLSLSSSYWPMIWPSANNPPPTLISGALVLNCASEPLQKLAHPLPEPEDLPAIKSYEVIAAPTLKRWRNKGPSQNREEGWHQPPTETHFIETDTTFGYETSAQFNIDTKDSNSARAVVSHRAWYARSDGTALITSRLAVHCDEENFCVEGTVSAEWEDQEMSAHQWTLCLPRGVS